MDGGKKLRLFIALNLPEGVKDLVEKAQQELRASMTGAAIRWTTRSQFHVTLKFLGGVDPGLVPALSGALADACKAFPPLAMRAEGIGFFPSPRRPRVVWVGVEDRGGQLKPLQQAIQLATKSFTSEEPEDRFAGHVTLGRVKELSRSDAEKLAGLASGLRAPFFGEWLAREIHLMQSELSPKGARYSALSAATLLGSGAME